jgi:hypothetical protein
MKNIHILPTDKPSRLLCNHPLKSFCFQKEENGMFVNDGKVSGASFWSIEKAKNNGFNPQHIYITSDEEIKEGDWFLYQEKLLVKHDGSMNTMIDCKKIILTTDPNLIKDGVQVINNEFLEWFVKNPSCDEVEIESWQTKGEWDIDYKIIIPKEEPKQETLEEIRKYAELSYYNGDEINAFVNGAKWQQERMYSEEEVIEIAKRYAKRCQATIQDTKWFEQLKKK